MTDKAMIIPPDTQDVVASGAAATNRATQARPQSTFDNFDLASLLPTVGKLEVTPEQVAELNKPPDPMDVEIRPDGLVYLPGEWYRELLNRLFPFQWAIIPVGSPQIRADDGLIAWSHWLIIKGHLMAFAIGEQVWRPENKNMTFTDACEGAATNALVRCCKRIGIAAQLWNPNWISEWKKQYAETYYVETGRGRELRWRKRAQPAHTQTTQPQPTSQQPAQPPPQPPSPSPAPQTHQQATAGTSNGLAIELTQSQWNAFCADPEFSAIAGVPPSEEKIAVAIGKLGYKVINSYNINEIRQSLREACGKKVDKPAQGERPARGTHWVHDDAKRRMFWAQAKRFKVRGAPLTEEQVHEILGVEHLDQLTIDPQTALSRLAAFVAKQNAT
jgi:hypothetical protein